ncbi:YqzE family protein [Robertmurraya korlensis]|uniref:YqzE family protein n=1 Tax=Robertmurraya korlensis TaxID=519977 RepID=UPI002040D239|nr:YqzE family protein [Robertmurraya korlensis]MCM3599607.1 YqzE family protein [Robertmurraya korlensis]
MSAINDYVKYITQTVVKYIDQPKEERKKLRKEKKETREAFAYRWFGILPYVIMMSKGKREKSLKGNDK